MKTSFGALLGALCLGSVMGRLLEENDSSSLTSNSSSIDIPLLEFELNETELVRDLGGNNNNRPHRPDNRPPHHDPNQNDPCVTYYNNYGNGWVQAGGGHGPNCGGNQVVGGGGGHHGGGGGGGGHGGGIIWGDNEGAYLFGKLEAEVLWKHGKGYQCDSIFPRFWLDVKKRVFQECENRWRPHGGWTQDLNDCKDGAADFVLKKVGWCADTADCTQIGEGASASVAGAFCGQQGVYRDRDWIPKRCKKHALLVCKSDVTITVQRFIDRGVCGHRYENALNLQDKLHPKCYYEIERMEDEASINLGHYY